MGQIIGLKFKDQGQVYYFKASPFVVNVGDKVLVKTEKGQGLGNVVVVRSEVPQGMEEEQLKPIYRIATEEDVNAVTENEELAKDAFVFCKECIQKRELNMKLVDVEVYFDRSKMIFYFTAPGRIDFRELVKDLVKAYKTRIELRQIGVRHETQMLGGVGNCGQVCCCRRFLRKFEPVTIKMAKEQNLFLNPSKISGSCGRLLCCLSYEQDNYTSFHARCPKIGKLFSTAWGKVKVVRANLFKDSVTIVNENGEERVVSLDDFAQLQAGVIPEELEHVGEENEVSFFPQEELQALQDDPMDSRSIEDYATTDGSPEKQKKQRQGQSPGDKREKRAASDDKSSGKKSSRRYRGKKKKKKRGSSKKKT